MAGREEGRRSNGQFSSNGQGNPNNANNGDLYKQLRDNNDMVKELDDIEAISQQISQHAEVLYNSWKSNGLSHGPSQAGPQQFKLGPGQANSSSGSGFAERGSGASAVNGRQYHSLRTDREGRVLNREELGAEHNSGLQGSQGYHSLERSRPIASSDSSNSPRHSTVSSPSSSTRESPQRGSSITHISHNPNSAPDVGPLELLASPNLNGNLEDLVSSFVSTDRAKQAARNTISSTIRRRLGSPNGSASPVRSPSPTSPLSFKNTSSPLRSPMMTNMASPSPPSDPQTSPRSPTSMFNQSESTNRVAVGFLQSSDIHAPMQSIFGKNSPKPSPSSPLQVHTASSPQSPSRPAGLQNLTAAKTSPLHIQTAKTEDSIPIPVKHIPIAISQNQAPQASPQPAHGLKSPSVLQNVNNVAPKSPFQFPHRPAGEGMEKMPNFFDEFGAPKDPETSLMQMRKRMEEAKQRMALSLPAREGGVRPNSFTAMGSRSLFDGSPWGDDPSAFLLEQFRRRNKRRMEVPAAPHPELTPQQKQHISDRSEQGSGSGSSIQQLPRRLLPNGSVAERVLMFEKSPSMFGDVRLPPQRKEPQLTGTSITSTPWRATAQDLQGNARKERIVPISTLEASQQPPSLSSTSSSPIGQSSIHLNSSPSVTKEIQPSPPQIATFPRPRPQPSTSFRPPSLHLPGKEEIPKFYFPRGNPTGKPTAEAICRRLSEAAAQFQGQLTLEQLGAVLKTCGQPLFWKCPVFQAAASTDKADTVTLAQVTKAWRRLAGECHDEAAMFVSVVTRGARTHLVPEDMVPLIQDVVDTHPGLLFLKEATEFHSRYVHTVIARIFYEVNRSWSGKITVSELRRSRFLATLRLLQDEDDINQVTDFFSYEHFYVIYCKFWELDKDHDLFIDREDLARHNDHALSTRMIERIFCGAVTRGSAQKEGRMSYTEFVWFLLSEEDKRHPTAIEYWFRCMDLDGDGLLSMYELEYFYEEQLQRMEQLGIETLPFDDCLCQMLDMIRPLNKHAITLKDLKQCKMTPVFFDTFFNLEKYLDHEQRDPFATQRETDEDGNEMSDWDRFAAEEYELLVAEEGTAEPMDDMCYDEGGEPGRGGGGAGGEQSSLDSEMVTHDS